MGFLDRMSMVTAWQATAALIPAEPPPVPRIVGPHEGTLIECGHCRTGFAAVGIWVAWHKQIRSRPYDVAVCPECGTISGFDIKSGRSWIIKSEIGVRALVRSAIGEQITEEQRAARLRRWIVPTC